ncbi:hypothetical protein EG329_007423 [Mollisiaceae sp. DMI_Dod_QoI]|nr:hypothetical protein EG329_007423 [Helotiales sp. DMI_Dod_QoI]
MAHPSGDYSTLEAVHPAQQSIQTQKPLPLDSGKQVVQEHGKEAWQPDSSNGIEVVSKPEYPQQNAVYDTYTRKSRRKWIILGGIAGLIVILAAVLGGVLGSRGKSKSTAPSLSPSSTPSSAPSNSSASLQHQSNIAAVSFISNNANRTKVYYQDGAGQLMEAADSANGKWTNTHLGYAAMNGSSLAAAVSQSTPLEISIFYTDTNHVIHDIIYNSSSNQWAEGVISGQKYVTGSNTSFAAMYHQCLLCSNTTVMVYQDTNGFVQFANLTTSGWELTQLSVNPVANTGLALQPFPRTGTEDQINLYYQMSSLNLSLATWTSTQGTGGVPAWIPTDQVYDVAISGTPLAAASSPSTFPGSGGYELWIELLSLSNRGIEIDTWSGAINDWLQHDNHPSVMANSTQNEQTYGSIAMTAAGKAFSVVTSNVTEIQSWQVRDDMVDWASIGVVDIGNVWS